MKTYARHRAHVDASLDAGRPRKRIRMDVTGRIIEEYFGNPKEVEALKEKVLKGKAVDRATGLEKSTETPRSSITAPSSPAAASSLFSSDAFHGDDDSELSSLPSSPPPPPSPKSSSCKSAISFLKRKRDINDDGCTSEPLSEITPNARRMNRRTARKLPAADAVHALRGCALRAGLPG